MARRKKKKSDGPKQAWLVTFGDLVTLLLTFFVLLLSMSSMDRSFISRVSLFTQDMGFMTYKGSGRVPSKVKLVLELMERPQDILLEDRRIKNLLFPDDVLPPDIDRATLEDNLEVLRRPEGVALALSDKLLFATGSATLTEDAKKLLAQVAQLFLYTPAPVNIAGYTDSTTGVTVDNYLLSGERAVSVLQYFLARDLDPPRFSVSAYGPDQPLADNTTEEGRARNRRVEILLKLDRPLGSYS